MYFFIASFQCRVCNRSSCSLWTVLVVYVTNGFLCSLCLCIDISGNHKKGLHFVNVTSFLNIGITKLLFCCQVYLVIYCCCTCKRSLTFENYDCACKNNFNYDELMKMYLVVDRAYIIIYAFTCKYIGWHTCTHVNVNGLLSTFPLLPLYLSPFLSSCIPWQNLHSCRYHYIGVFLLFILDIGDLMLEVSKSIIYFKTRNGKDHKGPEILANIGFAIFTLQW